MSSSRITLTSGSLASCLFFYCRSMTLYDVTRDDVTRDDVTRDDVTRDDVTRDRGGV